jgi:uncharacterized protein involved in exopolysaccharide biosynthesis
MPEELSNRRGSYERNPSARELVAVLFRQKRMVLVSFCGLFAAVLAYGLLTPSYRSEMMILVRKGRVDPVVTPTPTQAPLLQAGEISEEELNSEVQLLLNQDILQKVVRQAGLTGERSSRFWPFAESNEEMQVARAVRRLAGHLSVEPVRKTALIAVTYASSDPIQAEKVLQCLASAYLEKHRQLRRPSGEANFFEQQVSESGSALVDAEAQLAGFASSHRVVSAALQRDLELQKFSEADAAQKQLRIGIADAEQRLRVLQQQLASLPERTVAQVRTADNPLLLQTMKQKLLELELRRTELLTKFASSYRLVQEVEAQISDTQAHIIAEQLRPVKDETTEKDPNFEWAKSELMKTEVEITGLRARAAAADAVLAEYGESASRLGGDSIKQEHLLRNLKAAEDKYLLYAGKREEARIGDALDRQGILNVAVAQEPTVPALPAHSVWKFVVLGLIAACVGGIGSGFAADYLSPSFRTPDEVVRYLHSPVLASLPKNSRLIA